MKQKTTLSLDDLKISLSKYKIINDIGRGILSLQVFFLAIFVVGFILLAQIVVSIFGGDSSKLFVFLPLFLLLGLIIYVLFSNSYEERQKELMSFSILVLWNIGLTICFYSYQVKEPLQNR